eukprot:jgi/Mesvir1/16008/Mv08307-RA.2
MICSRKDSLPACHRWQETRPSTVAGSISDSACQKLSKGKQTPNLSNVTLGIRPAVVLTSTRPCGFGLLNSHGLQSANFTLWRQPTPSLPNHCGLRRVKPHARRLRLAGREDDLTLTGICVRCQEGHAAVAPGQDAGVALPHDSLGAAHDHVAWAAIPQVDMPATASTLQDIPDYVPLLNHSHFSLLAGASQVPALVKAAKAMDMKAMALADDGVMYGCIEFLRECTAKGIKPILGNHMYIVQGSINAQPDHPSMYRLLVLAKNLVGYQNLVALTSFACLHGLKGTDAGAKPCIDREQLERHKEGLIVACGEQFSELGAAILNKRPDELMETASWYRDTFGDDFYLMLQDKGTHEEGLVCEALVELASQMDIKLIATHDCRFATREDVEAGRVLVSIQTGVPMPSSSDVNSQDLHAMELSRARKGGASFLGCEFLQTKEELALNFASLPPPVVQQAMANTVAVADKVEVYNLFSEPRLPDFDLPAKETHASYLESLAWDGLCKKLNQESRDQLPPEYSQRLTHELEVIEKCGFSAYFLILWDIIQFALDHGIPVGPGRGSAAGSLVAYSLRLTGVDPVQYGLLFERFLNIERRSLPDIDTDFCIDRRGEVIRYITHKYGQDRVAQIVTFTRLMSRAVLKDVGKVMGVPIEETTALAEMVPIVRGKPTKLSEMISEASPSKDFLQRYRSSAEVKDWVDTAQRMEGTNKTFGVHAAGVVISPASYPLAKMVPLQRGLGDVQAVVTQYAMDDLERLGFLKMDILGLRNLTTVAHTQALVKESTGEVLPDLEQFPKEDPATYALLASGELDGIFQMDSSSGMKKIMRELAPSCLEDIFAVVALYRPGPLDAGLIPDYIARKHGERAVTFDTPALAPILQDTYGVLIYQEQIMRMARDLAGYSMGQADLLRRAMGKKKKEEMEAQQARFVEGVVERGVSLRIAEKLFEQMVAFSQYCFNKSHSAAYGYLAYVTAYLKANYPVQYMAALLSSARGNPNKFQKYLAACRAIRVLILPPCVNESGVDFAVRPKPSNARGAGGGSDHAFAGGNNQEAAGTGGARNKEEMCIRFGLSAVKHVPDKAANAILEARARGGPFASLTDLCRRVPPSELTKKALEVLASCGAMDCFASVPRGLAGGEATSEQTLAYLARHRLALLDQVVGVLQQVKQVSMEQAAGQAKLFDLLSVAGTVRGTTPNAAAGSAVWEDSASSMAGVSPAAADAALQGVPEEDAALLEHVIRWEKTYLGFFVTRHPLEMYGGRLSLLHTLHLGDAPSEDVTICQIAVVVTAVDAKKTKKGHTMATLKVEDMTGQASVTVLPHVYSHLQALLKENEQLLMAVKVQRDTGAGAGGESATDILPGSDGDSGPGSIGAGADAGMATLGSSDLVLDGAMRLSDAKVLELHLSQEHAMRQDLRTTISGILRRNGEPPTPNKGIKAYKKVTGKRMMRVPVYAVIKPTPTTALDEGSRAQGGEQPASPHAAGGVPKAKIIRFGDQFCVVS